jgi:hypothetical protein
MLVEDIIFEANVEPEALAWIDKYIKERKTFLQQENGGIKHDAFLKRLRKDIINNEPIMYPEVSTPLKLYEPKKTDPDFIKNATDPVYTIDKDFFTDLDSVLQDLFSSGERDNMPAGGFYKFHNLVTDPDLDSALKNKLLPLKKKYEQGKFNFPGLEDAMKVMAELGAQRWKHDKAERRRVETEAPVIMKFKNGYMWVRLDSKEEMEREGEMMQNCISGYCPIGEQEDLTFGLRDEFTAEYEPEEQTEDAVFEWLEQWLEENDITVQDYLMGKLEDSDIDQHDWDNWPIQTDDEEAFDWMANQIIDMDADIETGELTGGHLIYSLRDKNGESHVSAEYDPNVDMSYIEPTSALGKQNKPEIDKYKPYVEKLNDFFAEHPETFGAKGNTKDMPFHPDYDDDRVHDESVNEGDLIPNPVNTVAIKTMSDGDFYNLSKYMGDLDKASPEEFGMPDSAAVITFQDEEEMNLVLKRIKKHTGMQGHDISGHDDPGDSKTWGDKKGFKKNQGSDDEPLSLVGKKLDRMKNLAGKPHERRFDDHIERLKHLAGI